MRSIFFFCLFFLLSCMVQPKESGILVMASKTKSGASKYETNRGTYRYRSTRSRSYGRSYTNLSNTDPVVSQDFCRATTDNPCGEDNLCKAICSDLFDLGADIVDCKKKPKATVEHFTDLMLYIEAVGRGGRYINSINMDVLKCMLSISLRPIEKEIITWNKRNEILTFLSFIAENPRLAEVLLMYDDKFSVLKTLLGKIGSSFAHSLTVEIKGSKTFLWLSAISNENAWNYLNGYVVDQCAGPICLSNDTDKEKLIKAYCNALIKWPANDNDYLSDAELADFLREAKLFEKEYKDDVEDNDYLYEVKNAPWREGINGDFRAWCSNELS